MFFFQRGRFVLVSQQNLLPQSLETGVKLLIKIDKELSNLKRSKDPHVSFVFTHLSSDTHIVLRPIEYRCYYWTLSYNIFKNLEVLCRTLISPLNSSGAM